MRAEFDETYGTILDPEEFVQGVDVMAWDVLPNGTGVIALEPRAEPQMRLVLGA